MTKHTTSVPPELGAEELESSSPLLSLTAGKFASTSTGSMELVGLRERKVTKVSEFEAQFRQPEEEMTALESVIELATKKWSKFSWRKVVVSNFPILLALKRYQLLRDLPSDLVAGLTSGIMMIPQAMAFASLSTLQPIIGLYISLFSSLTYFVLGTGQQTSFGCIAILSIMMGSILDKYESQLRQSTGEVACSTPSSPTLSPFLVVNETSSVNALLGFSGSGLNMTETSTLASDIASETLDLEAKKLGVAGGVTLLCGIIFVVLGKIGLGKVTIIISDSLVMGVTVGAAFHVGSSQLKTIFGLGFLPRQSGLFKLLKLWYSILANIHRSNPASIIASLICILAIYLVKRFVNEKYKQKLRVPVPIELFVMVLATVVTYYGGLNARFGISIIKEVPTGVPKPRIPDIYHGLDYLTDGLIIIIVAFIQTVSVAKLMGLKHQYKVDSNQEMFAIGMVNIMCAVFSGYISGASVSRSVVQDSAGGKSQIASLFAALLVLLVMLFIGPYFYYVPKCALSAIIVVSLRSLMLKLLTIPDVWRKSKVDCIMFVTTTAAVVILDADIGLLVGVVISVFLVLFMTLKSCVDVTAHIPVGEAGFWRSKENYYGGEEVTGVKVVRLNSPLYFVNAEIITNTIYKKTGLNPLKMEEDKLVEVLHHNAVKARDGEDTGEVGQKTAVTDRSDPAKTAAPNGTLTEDAVKRENHTADPCDDKNRENHTTNPCDDKNGENHTTNPGNDKNVPNGTPTPGRESLPPPPPPSALPFTALVLDLSGVSFIDLMGVKALEFLIEKYGGVGVSVYVTNVTEKCLDTLKKSGFMAKHGGVVLLSVETVIAQLSRDQNGESKSTRL